LLVQKRGKTAVSPLLRKAPHPFGLVEILQNAAVFAGVCQQVAKGFDAARL
jgi:hypothetical protein